MINLRNLITSAILTGIIVLTGCSAKTTKQVSNASNQQTAAVTEAKKTLTISDGTLNMRNTLKEMKEKFGAKDEDGAVKVSSQLEENWSVIEDSVKDKNKELYENVEGPLDTINAAVKITPLDVKTITTSIDLLDKVLTDIQKLK